MTPAELSYRLQLAGLDVDERKLTDWRQKGMLPLLQNSSRGRSRGVFRSWTDPDIFERAGFVAERLAVTRRSDECLYALFLAGFSVEPDTLRRSWSSRLERQQRQIRARARRRKDGLPAVVDSWFKHSVEIDPAYTFNPKALSPVLAEAGLVWADQSHQTDASDIAVSLAEAFQSHDDDFYQQIDQALNQFLPMMSDTISISQTVIAVQSASDTELETLSRILADLRRACIHWVSVQPGAIASLELIRFAGEAWKVYGPLTASVGLQAAKHDILEPLAETVSLAAAWTGTISQADFVRDNRTFILSKQAMASFRPIELLPIRWTVSGGF